MCFTVQGDVVEANGLWVADVQRHQASVWTRNFHYRRPTNGLVGMSQAAIQHILLGFQRWCFLHSREAA